MRVQHIDYQLIAPKTYVENMKYTKLDNLL